MLMVILGTHVRLDEVAAKLVLLAATKYLNPLPQCAWELVLDVLLLAPAHRAKQTPVDKG